MTRINAGIPPEDLSDKHLLAEHREIKRIPNMIASGKAVIKNIPDEFCLGKGHVKFFYNKILYLHLRYTSINMECQRRGFNIQSYAEAFINCASMKPHLYNDWDATTNATHLIKQRIIERS